MIRQPPNHSRSSSYIEDFDSKNFVKTEDHARDLNELKSRVQYLEDKFGSPTKIANTLLETSHEAAKFSEMFEKNFLSLIEKNEHVRNSLKKLIDDSDRKYFVFQIKKWGSWVSIGLGLIMYTFVTETCKWIFQHFIK